MNKSDLKRNYFMLDGRFARKGYDWWWHNFTAVNEKSGEERAFFIEYFTCNPALANQKKDEMPLLGQAPENKEKGIKPSYLMVKCGCWGEEACQLHRFFAWKDVKVGHNSDGFYISAADCSASEKSISGSVQLSRQDVEKHPEWMCDAGSMSWDIKIEKKIAFNVGYGACDLFRKLKAFEMFWHAEGMKSLYSGKITVNGESYIIKPECSYGYADKNWGGDFTSPWVWLSSCDLVSRISGKCLENSVFDIGGGRPKAFGIAMNRKLLSDFFYEGKSYEFNFSKFWTLCRTKFDCKESDDKIIWYVRQETVKAVMETSVECDKKDMLLINYEAPDGAKRHNRLWNGGNGRGIVKLYKKSGFAGHKLDLIDEIEAGHIGCEWGEYC
ncbi:MAG: hypothetical protein K5681_05920 [Treponema sp.]|nr:hypothetical protein [Treponema sp.]